MDVSQIGTMPTNVNATTQKTSNSTLTTNDFYKLLAAEMKYEDPTSSDSGSGSSSSSSYITELAILGATTSIESMTKVENYAMGAGLVGKAVSYNQIVTDATGQEKGSNTVVGKVEGVNYSGDVPYVFVATTGSDGKSSGRWVQYSDLNTIYSPNDNDLALASSLIGKTIDYDVTTTDANNKTTTTTVKGTVDKVDVSGEFPKLYVTQAGQTTGSWINYTDAKTVYNGAS